MKMKALTATVIVAVVVAAAIVATATYASTMTYSSPSNYSGWQGWVPRTPNHHECTHKWGEYPGPHAGTWAHHSRHWRHPCVNSELINISGTVTKVDEENLSLVVGNETVYLRGWWVGSDGKYISPQELINTIKVGDEVDIQAVKCWGCNYLVAIKISVNGTEYSHPCLVMRG